MKRFLIILLIILVVGGIVAAGYFLSTRNTAPTPNQQGSLPAPAKGGLPLGSVPVGQPVGEGAQTTSSAPGASVFQSPELASFAMATDTSLLGITPGGKIIKMGADGSVSSLSDSPIDNLTRADLSYDATKAYALFGGQLSIFDVSTKTWKVIASDVTSAAWKNNSHILGFVADKQGIKTLYSLDSDNAKAKPQPLLSLHLEDINIFWPDASRIFISGAPSAFVQNFIFAFDTKSKTLVPIVESSYGADSKWDDFGNMSIIFVSNLNGHGGFLKLTDQAGKNTNRFSFLTLPEKCLFAYDQNPTSSQPIATSTTKKGLAQIPPPTARYLYCAVPRNSQLLSSATLPDDYNKRALMTSDDIYKIDLETGSISPFFEDTSKNFDIQSPKISFGKYYFLNRFDNKLYSIPL